MISKFYKNFICPRIKNKYKFFLSVAFVLISHILKSTQKIYFPYRFLKLTNIFQFPFFFWGIFISQLTKTKWLDCGGNLMCVKGNKCVFFLPHCFLFLPLKKSLLSRRKLLHWHTFSYFLLQRVHAIFNFRKLNFLQNQLCGYIIFIDFEKICPLHL